MISDEGESDASADEVVNPWARGGAMSDPEQVAYQARRHPAVRGSDGGRPSRHPSRSNLTANLVVATVALMLVARAVVWSIGGQFGAADIDRDATSTSPAPTEVLADVAEINDPGPDVTETSIGLIRWTSVQGDRSTLPAGVIAATGPTVAGRDDDGELALPPRLEQPIMATRTPSSKRADRKTSLDPSISSASLILCTTWVTRWELPNTQRPS